MHSVFEPWQLAVGALLVFMNLLSFGAMWQDKRCARRESGRIPEAQLFAVTACFGGLGGVLGMYLLRHKTRHWYFRVFFPLLLVLQLALLGFGAWRLFGA